MYFSFGLTYCANKCDENAILNYEVGWQADKKRPGVKKSDGQVTTVNSAFLYKLNGNFANASSWIIVVRFHVIDFAPDKRPGNCQRMATPIMPIDNAVFTVYACSWSDAFCQYRSIDIFVWSKEEILTDKRAFI